MTEKKKVGRNEPCPCGSGRKYKHCCLLTKRQQARERPPPLGISVKEKIKTTDRFGG